jgi:hypothetical protein
LKNILPKIVPFLIFTVLMAAGPLCLIYTGNQNWLIPQFWLLFGFVGGLTLLALIAVLVSQAIDPEIYAQVFMAATVFKLLACLVFILVFVLKHKVDKPVFMADFFYLYFLNTGFEIYVLLRNLRNQNLK